MITAGIDIGSLSTKCALMDEDQKVIGFDVVLTGGNNKAATEEVYKKALANAKLKRSDVGYVVTTGYGRENIPFADKHVSEITCHALGMHITNPEIRTILEIGGQDSKAIRVNEDGHVDNFHMNDKCAAGCGRFLEVTARAMGVELGELGGISEKSENTVKISSTCTVFAETEIVSLVAVGTAIPDIVKGVHNSIATRATSLLRAVGLSGPLGMSGGVALNSGVVKSVEEALGKEVYIVENPQVRGAIGAASIGQRLV
ncbi:MAG: acyl-CoA dehydratase activase [Rhodospirillales bacterium]|nr:acyl-CoA dehydratase activase [Rhodospirillales bacterium]